MFEATKRLLSSISSRHLIHVVLLWADLLTYAHAAPLVVTNLIAAGDRFQTESYVHDSGQVGPIVMIVGGAHGDEPAGAAAAEVIRHWPITRGRLVVIPRSNVPALKAGKRLIPNLGTNLSNLNRNYPRAGKAEPPRGELATAIWDVALKQKPDWLLDLHEGFDFSEANTRSVGSSIIVFPLPLADAAAKVMLEAVNATIPKTGHKFVRRSLPVDGSLARAACEHLGIPAMTLETTTKQPLELRIQHHEIMVRRLLEYLRMWPEPVSFTAGIKVALYRGPGTAGKGPPNLLRRFNATTNTSITEVTPDEIRAGVLTNYDAVIFAGGSGSAQAKAIGDSGREAVKLFVGNGGGYIGICAGAYLATSGFPWSLHIINARTVSSKWQRGVGEVKVELTDSGRTILGDHPGQFAIHYANGPIVKPADEQSLPPFETLAFFRTELAKNNSPAGVMVDSPAMFAGQYKRGRVVCISPHPEQTDGLEDFVPRAVSWVVSKASATTTNPPTPTE